MVMPGRIGEVRCMSTDAPVLTAELVVDGALPEQPAVSPDRIVTLVR